MSGFDDFQFIHQASKSPLYHGYLLKMEGDEVVLNKIDQEIAQCAAEARAELEQGEMQRRYARMQGFCSALRWKVLCVAAEAGSRSSIACPIWR